MPSLYLDSSALVKYYLVERGSVWMAQQIATQRIAATTLLSNVEVMCALRRAYRSDRIGAAALESAERRFLNDMRRRYLILDSDLDTTLLAVRLAIRHPLRAYDTMHLATALVAVERLEENNLPACTFVSADHDLLAAARAEGLQTENPNDHDIA